MCGILAILNNRVLDDNTLRLLSSYINHRGSDYSSPLIKHNTKCGLELNLKSSVLHLRGDTMQTQPVIDKDHNVLMFNGQIYKFRNQEIPAKLADTSFLVDELAKCKSKSEVAEIISHIDGPFALVYWHQRSKTFFYCRDVFGRKSLCLLRDIKTFKPLALSSVAVLNNHEVDCCTWSEVDCKSIHCIECTLENLTTYCKFDWNLESIFPMTDKCSTNSDINSHEVTCAKLMIRYINPLSCDLRQPKDISEEEMLTAINVLGQKFVQAVSRRFGLNRKNCLICRKNCLDACEHSKVAVAFSGGIDSTLIALALDSIVEENETIDLITVAFKSGSPDRGSVICAFDELRQIRKNRNWRLVLCDVSIEELRAERNERISNLISPCYTVIDDSLGCACWFIGRGRGRAIDSKMIDQDLASKLELVLEYNSDMGQQSSLPMMDFNYKSPASMIFVGSSIDEQLGGYSSHRSSWSNSGLKGVHNEISFLMRRLSSRNLGRDDRCYSDHGRDVKLPYLDFELVSFLNQLPIGLKMNLDEPLSTGPKKILRRLAKEWGLDRTCHRVKRAMQFGSRIANLENNKEKGNEICSRLRAMEVTDQNKTS